MPYAANHIGGDARPDLDILDAAVRKADQTVSDDAASMSDDRHYYCKIIMAHRDLKYLSALGRAGSFGRAATSLGINTSTIGRRIGRLEDELKPGVERRRHKGLKNCAENTHPQTTEVGPC